MELTPAQVATLSKYETAQKALTANQQDDYAKLIAKRDSKPELDDTAKKWVQELFRTHLRSTYTKGFTGSKHTEKGNSCEQSAIDRVARVMGWGPTIKSSKEFHDNIGTGHPDIWKPAIGSRADVKCSWTDATFPLFDDRLKNTTYEWQGKRYCMQAGVPDWWIIYCLENTPEPIVLQEAQRLWKESGNAGYILKGEDFVSKDAKLFYDETKALHNFDHLADWERVKPFKVTLTDADVTFADKRVQMSREYAGKLFEDYKKHELQIKSLKTA